MTRPELIEFLKGFHWVSLKGVPALTMLTEGQIAAIMPAVDSYVSELLSRKESDE